jgi:hypothetical protein
VYRALIEAPAAPPVIEGLMLAALQQLRDPAAGEPEDLCRLRGAVGFSRPHAAHPNGLRGAGPIGVENRRKDYLIAAALENASHPSWNRRETPPEQPSRSRKGNPARLLKALGRAQSSAPSKAGGVGGSGSIDGSSAGSLVAALRVKGD